MSYAYVGCRTTRERNARGKGLKVYRNFGGNRRMERDSVLRDAAESVLSGDGSGGEISLLRTRRQYTGQLAIKIEWQTETLSALNTIEIGGKNPVFITLDRTKPATW
ncbi:MAG: hypothetical protein ACLTR6_12850 [Clostridium fessum]